MLDTTTHLTRSNDELLVILAEECAEVTQAITKILRHGSQNHHPTTKEENAEALHREVGDLLAIVKLLYASPVLDEQTVQAYCDAKLARVRTGQAPFHFRHVIPPPGEVIS